MQANEELLCSDSSDRAFYVPGRRPSADAMGWKGLTLTLP
jgi:hypothetical protein